VDQRRHRRRRRRSSSSSSTATAPQFSPKQLVLCFSLNFKTRAPTTKCIALYEKMSVPQANRPPPTLASLLLLPAHANPRLAPQVLPRCSFPLPHRTLIAGTTTSTFRYMQPLRITHHVTRLLLCSPPPSPPLPSTRPRQAA
jgi:hypothetical protein